MLVHSCQWGLGWSKRLQWRDRLVLDWAFFWCQQRPLLGSSSSLLFWTFQYSQYTSMEEINQRMYPLDLSSQISPLVTSVQVMLLVGRADMLVSFMASARIKKTGLKPTRQLHSNVMMEQFLVKSFSLAWQKIEMQVVVQSNNSHTKCNLSLTTSTQLIYRRQTWRIRSYWMIPLIHGDQPLTKTRYWNKKFTPEGTII